MPDLDIPDDGFLQVRIAGVEKTVDAYASFNHCNALREKFGVTLTPEEASEWNVGVVEHLMGLGFPRVSQAAAAKFVNAVYAAVEKIRGNADAGPTPGSPGSTEPPPSNSPAE